MNELRVCDRCFEAIRSRGEAEEATTIFVDETDENESHCDWCDEHGFDRLHKID